MDSSAKTNIIRFAVTVGIGAALAVFYVSLREFPFEDPAENYRTLADALTTPGLLFVMFGALTWVSRMGILDGVAYGLKSALAALIPGARIQKEEKYAEYLENKMEKRLNRGSYAFLFWAGLLFLAGAAVFIILFYNAAPTA